MGGYIPHIHPVIMPLEGHTSELRVVNSRLGRKTFLPNDSRWINLKKVKNDNL